MKAGVIEGKLAAVDELKAIADCHPAKDCCPCCLAYCKRLFATSRLLLKRWLIKKEAVKLSNAVNKL